LFVQANLDIDTARYEAMAPWARWLRWLPTRRLVTAYRFDLEPWDKTIEAYVQWVRSFPDLSGSERDSLRAIGPSEGM
jgi:hypothetical protein